MRKAPWRPNNEITQQYNDGVVKIYAVTDKAKPGYQPDADPKLKYTLRFENRALGLNRIFMARQNHVEILKVIRVQKVDISTQDIAIVHDGTQYDIDTVQEVMGVYPASMDLSLKAVTHEIEVIPE